MQEMIEKIKNGNPIFITPYKENKVWGIDGVGEYWYGAEAGEKSSIFTVDGVDSSACDIIAAFPKEILGKSVVEKYGNFLPLVKVLTPKGRLSVQFHDKKNELWVVTGIDEEITKGDLSIIIGFSKESVKKYGDAVASEYKKSLISYGDALNDLVEAIKSEGYEKIMQDKKDVIEASREIAGKSDAIDSKTVHFEVSQENVNFFYNKVKVSLGDVIPVPQGTLHALGAGIEVVEPQIAGPTQSLEDGTTYPIRYNFPEHPVEGAKKSLDIDRVGEMISSEWKKEGSKVLFNGSGVRVERLPGGFEDKGMAVDRISIDPGNFFELEAVDTYRVISLAKGKAELCVGEKSFKIPRSERNSKMILIPSGMRSTVKTEEGVELINTYTP